MSADSSSKSSSTGMIWSLAWPQILMMFFHFWIGFVDVYVAGKLNEQVQAALGIITQALFFFLIVAMALANGAVSAVSQSLGGRRYQRAQRYIGLALGLVFGASLVLALISLGIRDLFLDLMQVPLEIREVTDYFLLVYLLLLPVYYLFVVSNAVFRAQKRVHIPLLAMIICTVMNTLGDFGLGLGYWGLPQLGYPGLAWATFISVACGCLFNLVLLYRAGWLKLSAFPPWRWVKKGLPYLWSVAWPAGLMQALWQSAFLVLFAITASLPQGEITALAALTAGLRLESILFLPAVAFNMTAAILVGHYLGDGDLAGAKRIGFKTWALGCGLITICGALLWIWASALAGLLSPLPEVQAEIVNYLHFNILAIPFTATSLILGGVFIGAGATRYNMLAIGGTVWLVRLPLAFLLGHYILAQATGVWAAMLISQCVQASLMLYIFQRWDWYRFSMQARKMQKKQAGAKDYAARFPEPIPDKAGRV
ncbi:MAG: MATE family efflux transporter [Desulfohalobiaceae bacterium]